MITRMNRTEAHALLRESKLARLGCIADGEPYVVPINYALDGESVLLHMLPGRKLTAVRQHPRACLQVDRINDQFHWQSVIASCPVLIARPLKPAVESTQANVSTLDKADIRQNRSCM